MVVYLEKALFIAYKLFPLLSQANEMLLLGHKMTASEAYSNGLVTRVFSDEQFESEIKRVADKLASLPPKVNAITLNYFLYLNTDPCYIL